MTTAWEFYRDLKQMVTWKDAVIYALIICVTWIVHKLFIAPLTSPLRKFPGPQYYPIVGNMLEILRHSGGTNTLRWMKKFNSRIIRYYFYGGEGRLLVADPLMVKHIMVTNSHNYHRLSGGLNRIGNFSNSILVMNGEKHRNLRKVCNPAFFSESVKQMVPIFGEKSVKLCDLWDGMLKDAGTKGVPVAETLARMTLEVMCKCVLNKDFNAIENPNELGLHRFRALFEYARPSRLRILPFSSYLPLKENIEHRENQKYFQKLLSTLINSSKEQEDLDMDKFHDLLTLLLQARDEDGNPMPEDVLKSQVGTFFFAGYETTSSGLSFIFYLLSKHPEIQEKVRKEILSVLPDSNMPVTLQALDKMEYLTCVIKESLRMYSPVSTLFRVCVKDDVVQGYKIPANTPIGISISALHRLPENWENPDEFIPDRFLDNEDNMLYKYLPFGAGATKCIGYRFSLLEMRMTLATVLRRFELSGIPGYNPRVLTGITLRLQPPLYLNLRKVN